MASAVEALLLLGVLALFVMTLAPFAQAAAVALLGETPRPLAASRPRLAVLTPAHDEAGGIEGLVRHVLPQLAPGDRLLVVADNCTDDTARLAGQAGAEVLVRRDHLRRGKGHALAAGLQRLAADPPEVVIFLDADCRFGEGALDRLSRAAAAREAPVQCLNLMEGGSRLAEFAWRFRNDLRPSGQDRLGLPCQLFGTGMAMPWRLVEPARFATGAVAEDLVIGLGSAMAGAPPRFERRALVTSRFPETVQGRLEQKRRWVHGHLEVIARLAWPTFREAAKRRDVGLAAMALDIMTPPLSLLAAAHAALLGLAAAHAIATGGWLPVAGAMVAAGMLAAALVVGWARHGRGLVGWREAAAIPAHALRVLRLGGLLARRRSAWTRADRSRGS